MKFIIQFFFLGVAIAFLNSCGTNSHFHHRYSAENDSAPNYPIDVSKISDAIPKIEPLSKHGNPIKYTVLGHTYYLRKSYLGYDETGIASWYGMKFHSFKTSSGEMYDVAGMTAANKVLPIPCYAVVTNLKNGKQVIVKINDRGPFHENRIIDLSYVAAVKLGIWPKGSGLVRVQTIDPTHWHKNLLSEESNKTLLKKTPFIYIQIGAFRSEAYAKTLVLRIQKITSKPIKIKISDWQDKPIYKVQIGPLDNITNSDQLFYILQQEHLGTPITVIN